MSNTKINKIDIGEGFGAYLEKGGLKELLSFAPLKKPKANDWYEVDGLEVDLDAPRLDSRTLSLSFILKDCKQAEAFENFLIQARTFRLAFAPCFEWDLRFVALAGYDKWENGTLRLKIKFAEDKPITGETSPVGDSPDTPSERGNFSVALRQGGELTEGVLSKNYGVRLLKGYVESIKKHLEIKQGLASNNGKLRVENGKLIPNSQFSIINSKKSYDFELKCYLKAESLEDLKAKYYALMSHLIQPQARVLKLKYIDEPIKCYYQSCRVQHVYHGEKPSMQFELKLKSIFNSQFSILN